MKRQMWKYDVKPGEFSVEMPKGAEVLSVAMQLGEPKMWASVDPVEPMRERRFVVVGTGHDVEGTLLFIGTFFPEPWLVFHLFERQGT